MAKKPKKTDQWTAGFICAVGLLLDFNGHSCTDTDELMKALGPLPPADEIEEIDREKLRLYGYL